MSSASDQSASFLSWEANDWDELSAVWSGLAPGVSEQKPTFQAEELTAQQAGYLFQRWVMEAFRLSGIACEHSFRNPRQRSHRTLEEIDGLVYDGWQGFLVESKYQSERVAKVDIDPIFRLHLMAEHRPVSTLGLFFSVTGYTDPAIELVERLRPIRVLLFFVDDLEWAVQRPGSMMEMVRRKWLLALKFGRPYIPVSQYSADSGGSEPHAAS